MLTQKMKYISLAVVLLVGLMAARPGEALGETYTDEVWEFASALALIDEYGPEIREPRSLDHFVDAFGPSPDDMLLKVEERITLLPYEGAMVEPVQAVLSGSANSLDRARLLAGLLSLKGFQAQVMMLANSGDMVRYGQASPGGLPFDPESIQLIKENIAGRAPGVLESMGAAMPGLHDQVQAMAHGPEAEIFWVRVMENGQERDLVFSDLAVSDPNQGIVLTQAMLEARQWTVALSLAVEHGGNIREVLAYADLAQAFHLTPVTLSIQPEGNLESFAPLLLVRDQGMTGDSFQPVENGQALGRVLLTIRLTGPGEERSYTRVMVDPATVANEHERGFEITSSVRLTVVAGPVSDEEFAAASSSQLAKLADVLFEPDTLDENAAINDLSLSAIGLLDSMHLAAGHLGPGSESVLAFQARPSMIVERLFVETDEAGMQLVKSMDVLEPGHGLYGSDGSALALAMVEQGLYDAMLEDWLNLGGEAATTHSLMGSAPGTVYATGAPEGRAWDDRFTNGKPEYLFAQGVASPAPGWRLDPGPQAVPLLDDGTGGSRSIKEQRERLADICKVLQWGSMFVPASVVPSGALMGGLVEYHCKLAEAYNRSADVMNSLADMIAGEEPDMGQALEDLENQIKGLGRDLTEAIAKNLAADVVGGAVVRPVASRVLSDVVAPAMRWMGRRAGRSISRAIGNGAAEAAETGTNNALRRGFDGEMARLSRLMRDAGWTREQRRNFFRRFGCFVEGTEVLTPDGVVPIEDLAPGDTILARDPSKDEAVPREVLAVSERYVAECLRLHLQGGEILETSAGHPIYLPETGLWVNAWELEPGDMLLSETQGMVALQSMEYGACPAPSYDLTVDGEHTFLVSSSGILVHNNDWCEHNRRMLEEGLANNRTMQEILDTLEYPSYMREAGSWIPSRNSTLGDLVEAHYAGQGIARRQIPPMHTTDMNGWRGIRNSGTLQPPDSGAAWSFNGTLRDGNMAIRVREESRQFVEFVENSTAFGQNVRYWPNGIGNGTWTPEVPSRHLEYYNYNMDRWDVFPQRP